MLKKVIAISAAAALAFSGVVFAGVDEAQSALDAVNAEKDELSKALNEEQNIKKGLNQEIKDLESKIAMKNLEIKELDASIALTEEKIQAALEEIDKLEADILVQCNNLNDRLRAMYKNGGVGFVDVLLGSSSVTDFMTNMDWIQRIYDSDKDMLSKLETQHRRIQSQREYLEGLQADLELSKADEKSKKDSLEVDKAAVNEKKAAVEDDIEALEEQLDALNQEANRLVAEILALQGDGEFVGGDFTWPAPGVSRISSPFGYRIHPILKYNKLHTGMDIAAPNNTNVVASNSGQVIKAAWNNSYGYMIMIDHGGGIVTLYAHNNKLLVSTGDVVYKGQTIALSGATGQVTGPHVHFEVRVNGEYVDPANYIKYGV